jgi:hypothetical protein
VRRRYDCRHDADVCAPGLAQLAVEPQRVRGRRRVLYVDAHEVAAGRGVVDDGGEVLAAEVEIELEPERRRLDRHVRVEAAALELGEHLLVRVDEPRGGCCLQHLLAEHVDGGQLPARVELADDARRVAQLRAGDAARRDAPHDLPGTAGRSLTIARSSRAKGREILVAVAAVEQRPPAARVAP